MFYVYENLISREPHVQFLCGLSVEKYTDAIIYSDCKGNGTRTLDELTELLTYLTICRHSLHLGIMSFMLDLGRNTVYQIFVGWAVFLETLFSQLNLKLNEGYLFKNARYICKNRTWSE